MGADNYSMVMLSMAPSQPQLKASNSQARQLVKRLEQLILEILNQIAEELNASIASQRDVGDWKGPGGVVIAAVCVAK